MNFLKKKIKELNPLFEKGGKFEQFYFLYEAHITPLFQPNHTTGIKGAHIRDANDMKRMMVTVIVAMIPALLFGIWNVGDQFYFENGAEYLAFTAENQFFPGFGAKFLYGAIQVLPVIAVCYAVGLSIEFTFATIRQHPIAEGFLVSGILIPLVCPPTIPLWQVAIATAFAVILAKEVFGGTGMNLLNPALTARAFLFFAYPSQISGGNDVWVADGYTGATALGMGADAMNGIESGVQGVASLDFMNLFLGFIPGCIGETSTLMCLLGAGLLIATGVGSWRIMLSMLIGGIAMAFLLESVVGINFFGASNWYYHIVAGGFAFGAVFMATDPVSASHTNKGKIIYGFLAGFLAILIRVANPAYPEGVMLAILFVNVMAPIFDHYVIQSNISKRLKRVKTA